MGRHPGDLILSLSKAFNDSILLKDVIDPRLPIPLRKDAQDVIVLVTVALGCIHPSPKSRPSMQQVTQKLSPSKLRAITINLDNASFCQLINHDRQIL